MIGYSTPSRSHNDVRKTGFASCSIPVLVLTADPISPNVAIAAVVAPSSRNSRRRHLDSLMFIRMSYFASDRLHSVSIGWSTWILRSSKRLSSQQSLDSNGTVAKTPINATEEPNTGKGVCAVGVIGRRLLRPPRIRRRIAANPWREGAMLLTADKLNAAVK